MAMAARPRVRNVIGVSRWSSSTLYLGKSELRYQTLQAPGQACEPVQAVPRALPPWHGNFKLVHFGCRRDNLGGDMGYFRRAQSGAAFAGLVASFLGGSALGQTPDLSGIYWATKYHAKIQ